MIKKIFKGLLTFGIIGLGLFNFSYASLGGEVASNGIEVNKNGQLINVDGGVKFQVSGQGTLLSQYLGVSRRMLSLAVGNPKVYFFFDDTNNGVPYAYYQYTSDRVFFQGHFTSYEVCDELQSGDTVLGGCNSYTVNSDTFQEALTPFFNSITSNDYWGYNYGYYTIYNRTYFLRLCFSSQTFGQSVCFRSDQGLNNSLNLTGSIDGSYNLDFGDIPGNLLGNPPGWINGGGGNTDIGQGGIELSSNESAINYFEKRYGWDSSICYAGVDSLDYLYGQNGVSFQAGTGLSIFDIFEQLYGNTDLNRVYVWLNVWLLNHEQWFGTSGNPDYLGNYNSGTNQVDLYFDNLTFPFANKPVAFYFLTDNIERYSEYPTQGSEVVSYCNIKINSGSFDDIIDDAVKDNVNKFTEQSNKNNGLNPDGSNYNGDAWLSSGVDLAFSGDVSIKNTLKNFFDEFDTVLGTLDIDTNNRILPTWLVSAFLFVVLFKFLRKR